MDPTRLLDQFLGGNASGKLQQAGDLAKQKLDGMGGVGAFAGGAAAGGLLALLLGGKSMHKMAGGVVRYGGAAALGALAFRAYQNWQQGKAAETAPAATVSDVHSCDPRFQIEGSSAVDGQPFHLALVLAMIGAAKADGEVNAAEQNAIFEQVERLGLDAESKAFVFDALAKPVDLAALAAAAGSQEQAAELYLVSRLSITPDQASEKAYLQALAHRLSLPADLVAHLDRQAEAGIDGAKA